MLGILPAAGKGSRLQPLAFSKELLPVGSAFDERGVERPKAVSEYLLERMIMAGVDRVCFVISPEKADMISYFARHGASSQMCYVVQEQPRGLCDALFRAVRLVRDDEDVLIGLPDTVWFPADGFRLLPEGNLAFLLFPVDEPQRFDAVLTRGPEVIEIEVKVEHPRSSLVWGAFRMPSSIFRTLHELWLEPNRGDEYVGTLVNAYLRRGGRAIGVPAGNRYFDVGTVEGYRSAIDGLRPTTLSMTG